MASGKLAAENRRWTGTSESGEAGPTSPFRDDLDTTIVHSNQLHDVRVHLTNMKWWNKPSMYLLLPPFFVSTIALGSLLAPALSLYLTLVCRANLPADDTLSANEEFNSNCQTAEMHAKVSRFMMYISLIQSILAAAVSPKLGALSDRLGRRPILALSAFGQLLSAVVLLSAAKSNSPKAYLFLLISPVVDGLSGSIPTLMLASHAYATDCTPPAQRAKAFGLFRACFFGGAALGPALGGVLVSLTGNILSVFYFMLCVQSFLVAYILFLLPESRSRESMRDTQELHRVDTEVELAAPRDMKFYLHKMNIFRPLRMLWPNDGTRFLIKKNILVLVSIETIMTASAMGVMMNLLLYAEFTFHWTSVQTGYFISITGVGRVIALVVLLPVLMWAYRRFVPHTQHEVGATKTDIFLIRLSVLGEILAFVFMGLSRNSYEFALSGAFGAIGSLGSPTVQSTLTKHVSKENTGAVLGALSLVQSISTIATPVVFSNIYALTVGSHPATIFAAVVAVLCVALVLSFLVTEHVEGGLYDAGDGIDDDRDPRDDHRNLELESNADSDEDE